MSTHDEKNTTTTSSNFNNESDHSPEVANTKGRNLIIAALFAALLISVVAIAFIAQDNLQSDLDIAQLLPDDTVAALVGETAPDFEFLGEQGHRLRLSDYKGTPIVLNFWASWCPPCRMHLPHFQEAFDRYGNDVKFIMLNFYVDETMETARSYIDSAGYTFDVYFDEAHEGAVAYGVTGIPETFFINADGIVTDSFLGPIDYDTVMQSIYTMLE